MQRVISFTPLWLSFRKMMGELFYQEQTAPTRIDGVITNGGLSEKITIYGCLLPLTEDKKSSDAMIKIGNATYSLITKSLLKQCGVITDKKTMHTFEIVSIKQSNEVVGFYKYYLKEYGNNQ